MKRTTGLRRSTLILTVAAVLAATFLVLLSATLGAQQTTRYREDINGDGQVNIKDVVALILLGRSNPTDSKADYDSSGVWTVRDAILLARNIFNGKLSVVVPPPPPPPTNKNWLVDMKDNYFSPDSILIAPGDTVTWSNAGTHIHTSTSGSNCTADNKWNSGNLNAGQKYSFVFTTAGNYPYFCIPHCALGMTGKVLVVKTAGL